MRRTVFILIDLVRKQRVHISAEDTPYQLPWQKDPGTSSFSFTLLSAYQRLLGQAFFPIVMGA